MKELLARYRYELITAISGGVVMILELVGARMVAPYFGTSLYVWTAMIGVILGALSVGYWYGGRLADRKPSDTKLMKIITLAALSVLFALVVQEALLSLAARSVPDVRLGSLLAALVLFAPAALLLGIVSPYVVRLKLSSLKHAGESVGRLYAAGTVGSIAGTFLAGYWLIALFGNRELGFLLVVVLVLLSFFIYRYTWIWGRFGVIVLALGGMTSGTNIAARVVADIDSAYSRYLVVESGEVSPVRSLITDPFSVQSAQYVGQPDTLVVGYTKRFMEVAMTLKPQSALVVGGGAYTFPVAAARALPDTHVKVVEIDPALTDIAKRYFGLQERSNLEITHQDGRVFLNTSSSNTYELVFMDAFSSLTPPYQLTTVEAVRHEQRVLKAGGAVVTNVVAYGEGDPYLSAITSVYRAVFREVAVYQVDKTVPLSDRQNLLVVATDDTVVAEKVRDRLGLEPLAVAPGQLLTDDYAPVEQLINQR